MLSSQLFVNQNLKTTPSDFEVEEFLTSLRCFDLLCQSFFLLLFQKFKFIIVRRLVQCISNTSIFIAL